MHFKKLTAADRVRLDPALQNANREARMRDFSFFSLFMWAEICEVELAEEEGIFFIRSYDDLLAEPIYAIPHTGQTLLYGVELLKKELPQGFTLRSLSEECRDLLEKTYGDGVKITALDAEQDYLYRLADLAAMQGRKFAAKRNHIAALLRENASIQYEPVTAENLAAVCALHKAYRKNGEDENEEAHYEGDAVDRVLANFEALAPVGGLLRANGQPVGFFLGELQGDTLYLHVEKALRELRGAYPMLVRETAAAYLPKAAYENREEDDGDEGLRRSKESYRPCCKLKKYRATF